jgi:CheY-like chemotaxis protein
MDMDKTPHTEEYEEELKTALVCEDNADAKNNIMSALGELKYSADNAANAADAFEKLRFNRYDVVVINEKFSGENNEVLKHLQSMPMATRRHIFVALLGQNLPTNDNMKAFEKSVNAVISEKDLPNLKGILKKAVSDNDHFYKVYRESLIKMGKS